MLFLVMITSARYWKRASGFPDNGCDQSTAGGTDGREEM